MSSLREKMSYRTGFLKSVFSGSYHLGFFPA